jgi:hypothetical protein
LEEISELFGGDVDEVELPGFSGLDSNEVFAFFVVVFTHDLEEFEGPSVGSDA